MKWLANKNLWQWLLLALALGLLWLTLRSVPLAEVWAQLAQLRAGQLALLLAANLFVLATFSARWWLLLYAQGYVLPYYKLMEYRLAAFSVSYFTPGPHFGGEPLQIVPLTRRHAVPMPAALAALVLDKLFELIFNFTFVLLGALLVLEMGIGLAGPAQPWTLAAFALLFTLPVVILAALALGRHPLSAPLAVLLRAWQAVSGRPRRTRADSTHNAIGHFVVNLRESEHLGSRIFRQHPWLLAGAVVVSLGSWAAMIGEFWLMTHVLGINLTLGDAVIALLAARAASLIPLPAAVGALEASQALAMVSLGLPASYGVSLSLLIRGRDVLFGLIGMVLAATHLQKKEGERVSR